MSCSYLEKVNKEVCIKLNQLTFKQFLKELWKDTDFDCINKNSEAEDILKQYEYLKQYTTEQIKKNMLLKKFIIIQKILIIKVGYLLKEVDYKEFIIK